MTVTRLPLFMGALLFLVLTSCSLTRTQRVGLPESSRTVRSVVATIQEQVEAEKQHVGVNQAAVVTTLTVPETFPANFKQTRYSRHSPTLGKEWPRSTGLPVGRIGEA